MFPSNLPTPVPTIQPANKPGQLQLLLAKCTPKRVLVAGGSSIALVITANIIIFCLPRSVTFSYASQNCITTPIFLPNSLDSSNQQYRVSHTSKISVAGYPLYSHQTCISPLEAPKANTTTVLTLEGRGPSPLKKDLHIITTAPPVVTTKKPAMAIVATNSTLSFSLDQADQTFSYQLSGNGHTSNCSITNTQLSCDLTSLNLSQSATYSLKLERLFKQTRVDTIATQEITTVEAVRVLSSSITAGQVVQSVPSELTVTFNKTMATVEGASLYLKVNGSRQKIATTTRISGNTMSLSFSQPLARNSSFEFVLERAVANDQGFLPESYVLPFRTSGGPKVLGTNIGNTKTSSQPRIIIRFDAGLASDASKFVQIETNSRTVTSTVSISGNTITITPNESFARCQRFTVRVLDGIKNEFGISGGSAWQLNSRVLCQTTFSIGTSVQDRSITAYRFGTGASTIVYIGTTHGDEKSSKYILDSWINELEANYDQIPSGRTIVVIPNLNPDGFAASRRTNANNVDLNRNFPANNWKSSVIMPDKSSNPTGGGTAPLSEPESAALASYILSVKPRLVLTYHAIAGLVIPNGSGDSIELAKAYDRASNVGYSSNDSTHEVFEYDTTGAFEDWLHDKHAMPALLIELWTRSNNEFNNHRNAMWNMAKL